MKGPRLALVVAVALCRLPEAAAKPWSGITPGVSTRAEVIKKFGEPSKRVADKGMEVLGYVGDRAVKGTTQTQVTVRADGVVEQIVVFPAAQIDKATVEDTFGPACSAVAANIPGCYLKKLTDDFRTYFWYKRLGLVVFFSEDGKSVYSFLYNSPGAAEKSGE
jgi:hypothetical protein